MRTVSTGSFPGVKRPGRGADYPPPSKRRGHERVELYFYSPSGPSWSVIGRTLPFFLPLPLYEAVACGLENYKLILFLFYGNLRTYTVYVW